MGGIAEIVSGTKVNVGPAGGGYYKAKLRGYNVNCTENNGWKVKQGQRGLSSTFFPDHWTKKRLQEEIAFAFDNMTPRQGNLYIGYMSDGVQLKIHIENDIIISAYPNL